MSDRINAFVVVLDADLSETEAESTKSALLHFRGVTAVEPHVSGIPDLLASAKARHKIAHEMLKFLQDMKG